MRGLIVVAALVALSGCKSSQERLAAQSAKDEAYCTSIGAAPGSNAYTQCRLQLRSEENRLEAARLASAPQSAPITFNTPPPPPQLRSPLNCNSTAIGQQANTTCY